MHREAGLPLPACCHQRCAGSSGEDVPGGKPSPTSNPPGALPGEVTQEAWHWKPGRGRWSGLHGHPQGPGLDLPTSGPPLLASLGRVPRQGCLPA